MAPGASENGFASMLATLLRQNLDERPHKKATFARMRGRVAIVVDDIDCAVTLVFDRGRLTVYDGIYGIPDATVRTDWEMATKMSLVELEPRLGLPDPRGVVAREVAEASRSGALKVHGLLGSLPLMLRLTKVMSVVG